MSRSSSRQPVLCDSELLSRYLDGGASDIDQIELERHLNQCEQCREAIETLAADGEFWATTTQALASMPEVEKFTPAIKDLRLAELSSRTEQLHATAFASEMLTGGATAELQLSQLQVLQLWLDPSSTPGTLGRLGKYEVQEIVGQGGMGLVLKGYDTELQRTVALKTMLHHVTAPLEARMRLAREARAAAALRHPNIVSIFGLETWRDVPVIVMPLLDGGTLQQYAAKHLLSISEVLSTAIQIASALSALHAAGVVHRDLKPSNILLHNGLGHVLLSDFGLARFDGDATITHTDALAGTPFFMSPEQALGKSIDARSDLFSFGSVLYWLCTGSYPFRGRNNYETLSMLIHDEAMFERLVDHQVPNYVQSLIQGLLKKDAANRWQNAEQVRDLLQACLDHHHNSSRPLPQVLRVSRGGTQNSLMFASVVLCVLVCFVTLVGYWLVPNGTEWSNTSHDHETARQLEAKITQPPDDLTVYEPKVTQGTSARYGPLDELDLRAMLSDLAGDQNVHYWLRRLAYLQVHEIPPQALPIVQSLAEHPDHATRELAQVILNKNPFQEVDAVAPTESASVLDNPFQEVLPNE